MTQQASSYCFNPDCPKAINLPDVNFCISCGNNLLLNNLFRASKLLGQGGFGRTFLAVNRGRFDTPCVVKQLLPPFEVQKDPILLKKYIEFFTQEAKQLLALGRHSQIPELILYFEHNNQLYLVQELIEGQNLLEEMTQQGAFSEDKIRDLLIDLLPVIQFVHSHNVIHRDIKPENIMRRQTDNKFVLIDFGGAKQVTQTSLNRAGTQLYTMGYAPNEQMAGRVCNASDLYALGATCARLLTGYFPVQNDKGEIEDKLYDAIDAEWLWRKLLEEKGVTISTRLGDVLDKLLQYLAKNRYQSADEVLQDLGMGNREWGIGNGELEISSFPPSPHSPSPKSLLLRRFEFDVVTVDARGQQINSQRREAQYFAEDLGNRIILEMVSIPGGTFMMGSQNTEKERYDDESPQHRVTIAPFFMGKYPITQSQWKIVAALPQINTSLNPDPSRFKGTNRPVEKVSWRDAVEFCKRLSAKTGRNYRLPSEAEWEYACRAGTTTPFHFGETITPSLANYDGNYTYGAGSKGEYRKETTVVGSFQVANAFGLYDMHGNVWEWCADTWHKNYQGAPSDGSSWEFGGNDDARMLRGGCWGNYPSYCRSARRVRFTVDVRYEDCGFRVAVAS